MVGSEVGEVRTDAPHHPEGEMLRVAALSMPPAGLHGQALRDINLTARAGEVVGIAGIAGNGQSELFAALSGERLADRPDAVVIAGTAVRDVRASTHGAGWALPSCPRSAWATRPRRPIA